MMTAQYPVYKQKCHKQDQEQPCIEQQRIGAVIKECRFEPFGFKYLNLILTTIADFSSSKFDALDIILPAGISFFTFRSISYIVDIYRGDIKPTRNFLNYTFFLTFFPPLLAGPVVRAKDLMGQI